MRNHRRLQVLLTELAARTNTTIVYDCLSSYGFYIRFFDGSFEIIVNESDPIEEQVNTIAHEFGHMAYDHQGSLKFEGEFYTPEEYLTWQRHEREADTYMHDLLVILEHTDRAPMRLPRPLCSGQTKLAAYQ